MQKTLSQESYASLVKYATNLAVIVAALIIVAKIMAWALTDSVSVLATLVDSFLDIAASIINLFAVRYALQPPDDDHRFGHGKAEDLAVLTQSTFFALSGLVVMGTAIKKIFYPQPLEQVSIAIYLMTFSIFVTLILVAFQKYVIRKTKSNIIAADNLHYMVDLFTNLLTILALYLTNKFSFIYIDQIFALLISFYIIFNSYKLFNRALDSLMDRELYNDERDIIINLLKENIDIKGFHDLKTRYSGNKPIIQFHLEMDSNMTLLEAHKIVEKIENEILQFFPNAEILIHQDPEGIKEVVEYKD